MALDTGHAVILYDGVCGLCNRLVRFILKRDSADHFRFASLQSPFAAEILRRHDLNPADLRSVLLVINHALPGEHLLSRSQAASYALRRLGAFWRGVAALGRVLPSGVSDWLYDAIARNRYRVFGKYESCPLPNAADRGKFLDQGGAQIGDPS